MVVWTCLTLAQVLVVLMCLLRLLLEHPHLSLQLHPLPPQGGVVTHALQPLPQQRVLLAQQGVLGARRLQLHLSEPQWHTQPQFTDSSNIVKWGAIKTITGSDI